MAKDHIVILGLGMQGKATLYDLYHNTDIPEIIVADNSKDLKSVVDGYPAERVVGRSIDASRESDLTAVMRNAVMVVEALPPQFALPVGRLAARLGVNLVSSMYYINPAERHPTRVAAMKEELKHLNSEAKEKGITILPEFGLDPGIDLILGARALNELDDVHEFHSYGAGLPVLEAAENPLKYKFSWSVTGVMRAYKRPAWVIRQGRVVEIPGDEIFTPEQRHSLDVEEFGVPLECYPNGNSAYYAEAFRLMGTVKEMGRYACRYPGHCAFWEIMAKSGFLDEESIRVGDVEVSPIAFTSSLLGSQAQFQFTAEEQDIVMVRVDMRGNREGKKKRIVYQLIDRRDVETGFTAMQRTVGFTMGLGARLILDGRLSRTGLVSPMDVSFDEVVQGLEQYGIHITRQELPWN